MRWLWTFFGLGRSPVAPGTVGTLGGVAVVALAMFLDGWRQHATLVCFGTCLFVSGLVLGDQVEKRGRKDPGEFVLDEVVGYMVAVLGHPLHDRTLLRLAVAFVLFRIFDILKPWPVSFFDRMGGGKGIMLDDVAAGVYANAALWGVTALL